MNNAYLYHRVSARGHFYTTINMKKVFNAKTKAGSQEQNEPCLLGSIVEEMLHGKSPLAKGYRQYIVSQENGEVKDQGWNRNTDLGVDLKTVLQSDRSIKTAKEYLGVLRRDSDAEIEDFRCRDAHYTFTEVVRMTAGKRNPHVFEGKFISITRRDDGSLRPNFKPMKVDKDFCVYSYALGVFDELMCALEDLIEK